MPFDACLHVKARWPFLNDLLSIRLFAAHQVLQHVLLSPDMCPFSAALRPQSAGIYLLVLHALDMLLCSNCLHSNELPSCLELTSFEFPSVVSFQMLVFRAKPTILSVEFSFAPVVIALAAVNRAGAQSPAFWQRCRGASYVGGINVTLD